MKRKYLCILLVFTFVIATHIGVNADTIHVPSQYPTIQDGIDVAVNGDTVLIADGIYSGKGNKNLDFEGKAIIVQSENGPEETIIDCEGTGRGFYFHSGEHPSSVVRGFTIKNGLILASYPNTFNGGGIYCTDNSSPTIINNIIINNQADRGGGIGCVNSSPIIINNTITQNSAREFGGGIDCDENSSPVINGNLITGNFVERDGGIGGGVCIRENDSEDYILTLAQNTIMENKSDFGGGVGCINSFINLTDNTVIKNSGRFGGGISCIYSIATITNNIIAKNSYSFIGGGIYSIWNSSLTITSNTITENNANFGGGVYCDSYCAMKILNTILWANNAYIDGHQIYVGLPSNGIDITYSNVQGGKNDIVNNESTVNWGVGNIDIHPLFVDAYNGDYRLQSDSPCIDAGDPKSKKGPDGTQADIGVFYYDPDVIPVPTSLAKISGDNQSGAIGTVIADLLVAQVLDQHGDAVEGLTVNFDPNLGAIVNPMQTTTDENGQAKTVLTLGVEKGIYSVTAQAFGLEPVIFTATALSHLPTIFSVSPNSGDVKDSTEVTINGENFQEGAIVRIGEHALEDVVVSEDGSQIVGKTSSSAKGLYDVIVTNPDGEQATFQRGFAYIIIETGYPIRQTINLHKGINLISIPLKFETTWRMSDIIRHIGENDVNMIIRYDTEGEKFVAYMLHFGENAKLNVPVECDEGYIVVMKTAKEVVFEGYPCEDEPLFAPNATSLGTFFTQKLKVRKLNQ